MLYTPSTGQFKDNTVFWHDGKYTLFAMYSKTSDRLSDLYYYRNVWSAESDDGVHWRDIGAVIEDAPFAICAMGVNRLGNRFIMNHGSYGPEGKQNVIRFWESSDLRTWTYTGKDRDLYPDARWYDESSRLDCMTVLPVVEGERTVYYGYATGPGGFLKSNDGIAWQGMPQPQIDWGGLQPPLISPEEGILEIGGCHEIAGRFYLVGGWFNMMGMSGYGTYTLVGDGPVGPFRPDPVAYRLCGNSLRWVAIWARFCQTDRDVLVNGYMYDGFSYETGQTWLPPIKKAVLDEHQHLRLGYWPGNDVLKGTTIDLARAGTELRLGQESVTSTSCGFQLSAQPEIGSSSSSARTNVPTSIVMLDVPLLIEQGVVVEGTLRANSQNPRTVAPGIGFYLEETSDEGTAIVLEGLGLTRIGQATLSATASFDWEDVTGPACATVTGIVPGKTYRFRLLLRKAMFELYLDDLLVQTFNTTHTPEKPGRTPKCLGLLVQNGIGLFENLSAFVDLKTRTVRPRIGLLPTGHMIYWEQFPGLKEMGLGMYETFRQRLEQIGEVISPGLVDTKEKAWQAGEFFQKENIDILLIFPLGYTTGIVVLPCVKQIDVPVRILNSHLDSSYDYKTADTAVYLYHEGPCCIPEYAAGLVNMGRKFKIHSGPFKSDRFWKDVAADCNGAAAARAFRALNVGIIGNTYTGMVDMPMDEHRWLRVSGRLFERPEVEEIEEAYHRVTQDQLQEMYQQLRQMYDVDETVTDEHMKFSAQLAIAYEEVILKHDIYAFGYYWWGEKELITQLRSQSGLAVSRLASMGRPGVTEGDVQTAMAMKILDLLGAGGMFVEFFAMDYDEDFILMGHDGPSNINMCRDKPKLQHLQVHHGKTGHGLGIDYEVINGPATLLNLSQFQAGDTFKLVYSVAEIVSGEVLSIGNPNCRVKVNKPIHEFFDQWCQHALPHHIALGVGDQSREIEAFAEKMNFSTVRI